MLPWQGLKPKALAYPPPIEGGAPAAVNDLFSDLTPPLWDNFMAALKVCYSALLSESLRASDTSHGSRVLRTSAARKDEESPATSMHGSTAVREEGLSGAPQHMDYPDMGSDKCCSPR